MLVDTTMLKLAAELRGQKDITKKQIADALGAAGLQKKRNVAPLAETIASMKHRRAGRQYLRAVDRLGYVPVLQSCIGRPYNGCAVYLDLPAGHRGPYEPTNFLHRQPTGRKPVRLPAGTLTERLDELRRSDVAVTAKRAFRHGAAGGSSMEVVLTRDPALVGYKVEMGKNWNTYRGSYKGWSANEDHHTITVPYDWRVRVDRRGLDVLDGMMTLDASPMDGAPEGIELFAAKWAAQGRGFEVKTARGVIARTVDRRYSYHGRNAADAVSGIARKMRSVVRVQKLGELARLTVDQFAERVAPHADIIVTLADARAVGACDYGIRSWCNEVGLDYDKGRETLAAIVAGYKRDPRPEARAAILHAIQRTRRAM